MSIYAENVSGLRVGTFLRARHVKTCTVDIRVISANLGDAEPPEPCAETLGVQYPLGGAGKRFPVFR